MPESSPNYYAFLLRCWREDESTPWRVTLEDPHNSETIGFASLQSLFDFLDELIAKRNSPQNLQDHSGL